MPTRGPDTLVADCGTAAKTTAATTQVHTLSATPPKGSRLIVAYGLPVATSTTSLNSATDNAGVPNTWTVDAVLNPATGCGVGMASALIDDASLTTVSLTFSGNTRCMICAWYFTGSNGGYPIRPLGTLGLNTGSGSAGPIQGSTWTPAVPLEYAVVASAVTCATNATGITPSTGLTEICDFGDATVVARFDCAWRTVNNGSSVTTGCSASGAGAIGRAAVAYGCGAPFDKPRGPIQVYRSMPVHMGRR